MEKVFQDWIWQKPEEEFHPDCISYLKHSGSKGMMFWRAFRWRKIGPGIFFNLEERKSINSIVYRDQILLGPLKTFGKSSLEI